ncbi:MAG: hypothetical protein VX884_02475 [Pseudomonadota bacterium]|nr:hypothetical protein [Pseudomonadota bacterium]
MARDCWAIESDPLVPANSDTAMAIKAQYHKLDFCPYARGANLDVAICHSRNMPRVIGMRGPGSLKIPGTASQNTLVVPTTWNKGFADLEGRESAIMPATVNTMTKKKNFWLLVLAGKGGKPNVNT